MANETYNSMFCVINNPEWIFTYKHNEDGTLCYDENKRPIILKQEKTRYFGLTPEQICNMMLDEWTESARGRSGAVAYCISADGLHHVHAVFEADSNSRFRFSAIKKIFGDKIHIEPTRGNKKQAEDYINKEGKYAEKGEQVLYIAKKGEIKGSQGKRNDINMIRELIEAGKTPSEIFDTNIYFRKYEKMVKDEYFAYRKKNTPVIRDVKIDWLWGTTATGKTYTYVDLCNKYGRDNVFGITSYSNGSFDKYNGQPVLFLNEFRGQFPFSKILSITDEYDFDVDARYTDVSMLWDYVVFTSPFHPSELYEGMSDTDKKEQLYRRINRFIYCYREDSLDGAYFNKIIFNTYFPKPFLDTWIADIKKCWKEGKKINTCEGENYEYESVFVKGYSASSKF